MKGLKRPDFNTKSINHGLKFTFLTKKDDSKQKNEKLQFSIFRFFFNPFITRTDENLTYFYLKKTQFSKCHNS